MFSVGTPVLDRRVKDAARIVHVLEVPAARDLFGFPVDSHHRYTVAYLDGSWANDRVEADLEPAIVD